MSDPERYEAIITGPITVDMGRVRARKRAVVKSFRTGSRRPIESGDGLDQGRRRPRAWRREGRSGRHAHLLPTTTSW